MMRRGGKWWLALGAFAVLTGALEGHSIEANTFQWREEAVLHDGGIIVLSWWVRLVAGQPFQYMAGEQRLTFTPPVARQQVVWVDSGKVGSRLHPIMLDVDAGRLYLVGLPRTGPDYDGFGCPTLPYVVFRYDAGAWVRAPLSELPSRFAKASLLGFDKTEAEVSKLLRRKGEGVRP